MMTAVTLVLPLAQDGVPSAAMGEPLEVRPLLRATRHEDLAPETKALKELKPSFTRQVGGKGIVVLALLQTFMRF